MPSSHSPDDGPGPTGHSGPPPSGEDATVPGGGDHLEIEPQAIPELISSLQHALDQLGPQIEHAFNDLRIIPWAGDPVSQNAAERFNERSFGSSAAAFEALCGYRDQLQSAAGSLRMANEQYQVIEGDNSATWDTYC
ncbi:hypothetical protein C1701_14425 [Actinoalloteichus sp. AHMU CJ021]|uniref:PE family protein n=1 Tax=Actinoalloteichus caeruleus DSM 43889 TaxID=1120930 RepID=A0ABT1JMA2_ACTCY|nr:hypothetical protein [Actinoalloteichus caeruleus]AUS79359.1 hypothetical protein C1701_14425 [Actinoalloteichus sp. AHMU CJ021]MCP2333651.1 hypothetical protein [Actinoalloteichus caeruleus DSM 43889]